MGEGAATEVGLQLISNVYLHIIQLAIRRHRQLQAADLVLSAQPLHCAHSRAWVSACWGWTVSRLPQEAYNSPKHSSSQTRPLPD